MQMIEEVEHPYFFALENTRQKMWCLCRVCFEFELWLQQSSLVGTLYRNDTMWLLQYVKLQEELEVFLSLFKWRKLLEQL